ncbi:hypothetical protein KAI36_01068 [Paenibacillus sp. S02]|nr:hypothetical protein KAI36_01068 [Paenibacillus sp. S02]
MSLSDHSNEEAFKLHMAKRPPPTGKAFFVSNFKELSVKPLQAPVSYLSELTSNSLCGHLNCIKA